MKKIVVIACSTGGPKALQEIVPFLEDGIGCPVVIVQHMPAGFTRVLAERLDLASKIPVSETEDNQILENNHVYIAKAGSHLKIVPFKNGHRFVHSDEKERMGVKPCANYTYESLINSNFEEIICVVLTGMGSDGREGIEYLNTGKKIRIFVQDEKSSVVYGMPGSILKSKLECKVCKLCDLSEEIMKAAEG
ncbi:MAG: chemotaxis protein CheB [Lachnospiraceae bacterium]|nr:chemotaxis protein CheB [Lachnospiraceae bacterium]